MQNPKPIVLNPVDTLAFAPAAGSIAAATRRLAGSSFRPYSWQTEERAAVDQAAQFIVRVGFPVDFAGVCRVTLGSTPRHGGTYAPALPSRLVLAALALANAEGVSPQQYLDRAFDLLSGLCLCGGSTRPTMLGEFSAHGFGFTIPQMKYPTATRIRAAFMIDKRNALPRIDGFITRPQRALQSAALSILALQYVAEASDPTAQPLHRARLVAAAARLSPAAALSGNFGGDETGEALAIYARDAAATDDGSEAWARFATAADQARSDHGNTNAAESEVEAEANDARTRNDRKGDPLSTDSHGEENNEEMQKRAATAKALKGAPKGRSKVDQAASESNEATALAQGAAAATETGQGSGRADARKRFTCNRIAIL